jgi:hypothetical protein
MHELIEMFRKLVADGGAMGQVSLLGALMLASKYWLDLLRTGAVQKVLAAIEGALRLRPGRLQWSEWSDNGKMAASLLQAFLMSFVGSLVAGVAWAPALVGAVLAALGAKGVHDTGMLPGRSPGPVVPSPSRPLSLGTRPPEPL